MMFYKRLAKDLRRLCREDAGVTPSSSLPWWRPQ